MKMTTLIDYRTLTPLYLKDLHCYAFEPVKKRCSLSVLLIGMTFKLGFREKEEIQRLSEW